MTSSIEFKLFAPYNDKVTLKGSFSDWSEIEMSQGDLGYFRATVELEDGIYQYKFRLQSKSWFVQDEGTVAKTGDKIVAQFECK